MGEPLLSAAVYVGLILTIVGLVTLVVPLKRLRIPTRGRALRVLLTGIAFLLIAFLLPAAERRAGRRTSRLDEFHPRWQFSEFHQTYVAVPPAAVYKAVKATTASDITLFQTLTAIRRLGQPGPESILNAPENMPILEVATQSGFRYLADDADREVVVATLVIIGDATRIPKTVAEYTALDDVPGFAKATMNFHLTPDGAGTRLTTETRVLATDPASRRRFAAYWRIIYPGSSLIRYSWLRAIRLKAEAATRPPGSS